MSCKYHKSEISDLSNFPLLQFNNPFLYLTARDAITFKSAKSSNFVMPALQYLSVHYACINDIAVHNIRCCVAECTSSESTGFNLNICQLIKEWNTRKPTQCFEYL